MSDRHESATAHGAAGATPAHERLSIFVGTWHTVGQILDAGSGDVTELHATDTYEWLPGGHFLVHRVDGVMGTDAVHALEIIGCEPAGGGYFSQSYDNTGGMASYGARLEGKRWHILGASERFSGEFSTDGTTLRGEWERLTDGSWVPWMRLSLRRT